MDILTLQNFYKDSVKVAWTAGAGNFYVNTKPVPTSGILVVNPSSSSKREIIRYSAVGTDGTGDYITVSSIADRGLGGTIAQTHAVDEPIRMNITAEHWDNIQDAIDTLQADLAVAILAGASFASPTVAGIARLTNAPDKSIGTVTISIATPGVISRTAHGMLVNDRVKFTTTGALPTGIVASTEYYVIGTGLTADAFQISSTLGGTAINTTGSQSGVHTLVRTTPYVVEDNDARIPTTAEKARIPSVDEDAAMAGGSTFGTPSASNKFLTQDYNSSATGLPVVRVLSTTSSDIGSSTTQFDISNPAGTTFRYTWDSTGTDPGISLANNPIGSLINFQAQNFTAANNGTFVVTGAGSNYVEVTNASGVVEHNKTIGTGYVTKSGATGWTKPSGLKYIKLQVQASGGGGGGGNSSGSTGAFGGGGGGGGYSEKIIPSSSLSSTEYYLIATGGLGGDSSGLDGSNGRISYFGTPAVSATGGFGGNGSASAPTSGGTGGTGSNGDFNIKGGGGGGGTENGTEMRTNKSGTGGSAFLGGGAEAVARTGSGSGTTGSTGGVYGGGGSGGAADNSGDAAGGPGAQGVIIITEYFS